MKFNYSKKTLLACSSVLLTIPTCILITSCSKQDKLIISGSSTITTFVHYNGEEDYQAIDVKKTEPVSGTWNLEGADKDYFNISVRNNNEASLTWTSSALVDIREYHIVLSCSYDSMSTNKDITIKNLQDPLPIATHITIYGSNSITGAEGVEGHSNYVATDSNGHQIVGAIWSLLNNPIWLSITPNGLLRWTDDCVASETTFTILCQKNGLTSATLLVTLEITSTPIPSPTSISIYGSTNLTGVGGIAGYSAYIAIDSNGNKVNNGIWNINKLSGCDGVSVDNNGLVSWTSNASSGTFQLSCVYESLITISDIVTLTINNGPKPSTKIYKHLMSIDVRSVTFSYRNENSLPEEGFWYYSTSNKKETSFSEFILNAMKWVNPKTSILVPSYGQFIIDNDEESDHIADYIYIKHGSSGEYILDGYNFANDFIWEYPQSKFDNEFQSLNIYWFNVDVEEAQ